MRREKRDLAYDDYDEGSWLEDLCTDIIDAICWVIGLFVSLWNKLFVQKEKVAAFQIKYLEGHSIQEGNFYCLRFIPLAVLQEKRELIKNNFQHLFWKNPGLISGFIRMKVGNQERIFLDEIMSEIFNFSKQSLISAGIKVLSEESSIQKKMTVIAYMVKHARVEKQRHFISFFMETFKKMDDPMKTVVEEIIGEKL